MADNLNVDELVKKAQLFEQETANYLNNLDRIIAVEGKQCAFPPNSEEAYNARGEFPGEGLLQIIAKPFGENSPVGNSLKDLRYKTIDVYYKAGEALKAISNILNEKASEYNKASNVATEDYLQLQSQIGNISFEGNNTINGSFN